MFEAIGNFIGNQANSLYQGSGAQQAVNFGQGLIGQLTNQQPAQQPMMTPELFEQNRQAAYDQLTPKQQQWMGQADATDPYIRARMPQELPPGMLDPKSVQYKAPEGDRSGGGGGFTAASAPSLGGGGGGAVGGGGTQYAGGIPVILRSYGEPSSGLLKYIEG